MKLEIGKGEELLVKSALASALDGAGETETKVLLLLLSNTKNGIVDGDECRDEIISALSIAETDYVSAIAYWRGAKVLKVHSAKKKEPNETEGSTKHLVEDKLPDYKEDEMADKIEKTDGLKSVIDECQQIIGKIFSPADTAVIVGMSDRLGLSGEYITMLAAYCVGIGKKSLRYLEKTACSIYDEGVDTTEKLASYITKKESIHEAKAQIQKMTGAADRALTTKEKKLLDLWLDDFGYDVSVVEIAYEMAVNRIKGPQYIPYMGAIIGTWHEKGLRNADEVRQMLEAYKKSQSESVGGFDTDDFFNKAANKTKKKIMKTE